MNVDLTCLMKLENMSEFNFKSSPCTSIEQGERLLALGLKPETADMHWFYTGKIHGWQHCSSETYIEAISHPFKKEWATNGVIQPAWSLHRLIEMMPEEMYGGLLCIFKDSIRYEEVIMDRLEAHFEVVGDDMYENAISCIEWLIKEGYFNKEYLV